MDPTTGEQGVRQDQGRSTIAGKAADRELEWSWYKPASAGFLLPAIFAVGEPADAKSFLTPEFLPLTPLFEHEHVRYSERLTRGGGTWLFPNLHAAHKIGSIKW
ncbi:hypothetical protein [Pseudomonas meliae]|uniref:hypothetical protein n=1 Tax=Pseudomonas syringae group genomosp. 2 TaxID=251698 RepID=UPI00138F8056|nr:hypothetical protein [Pseudomonas meliae]